MNANSSGSHHLATRSRRCSHRSAGDASSPSFSTTHASGRSVHRSSGLAITAASATAGCAISSPSRSTDEIHSPPDLITSFERSEMRMNPCESIAAMSPVRSQPSWNLSSPLGSL